MNCKFLIYFYEKRIGLNESDEIYRYIDQPCVNYLTGIIF